ncbi:MAG: hypothetical protein JWN87_2145 [Frankiales bacterium]|nr:hypothetical protein [Frankiales bacterium]
MAREDRLIQIVVHASDEELAAITDRIGEVICVPPHHEGRCDTPWFLTACDVADIDDEVERHGWTALLDDER